MTWLPFGDRLYNIICPNMAGNSHYVSKCMGYGLWGLETKSLQTNSGNPKMYGFVESMGYDRYRLWESRLYTTQDTSASPTSTCPPKCRCDGIARGPTG